MKSRKGEKEPEGGTGGCRSLTTGVSNISENRGLNLKKGPEKTNEPTKFHWRQYQWSSVPRVEKERGMIWMTKDPRGKSTKLSPPTV